MGVHQYHKKQKCKKHKRACKPEMVHWSDKVSKLVNFITINRSVSILIKEEGAAVNQLEESSRHVCSIRQWQ